MLWQQPIHCSGTVFRLSSSVRVSRKTAASVFVCESCACVFLCDCGVDN